MKTLAIVVLLLSTSFLYADAISGSLPVVLFQATENGPNLLISSAESAANSVTSGTGAGDFVIVPLMTSFGAFSLNDLTVSSGGGFSMSNPLFGSFAASSGTIVTRTPAFLNVELFGVYMPGPAFAGETWSKAVANIAFDQTGSSVSGSYTVSTVPEPGTLALFGSAMLLSGIAFRRYLA